MKTCFKCGNMKSLFDFVLIDGRSSRVCRKCESPVCKTEEQEEAEVLERLLKEQRKQWRTQNPDKIREHAKKRYWSLKDRTPKWLTQEQQKQIEAVYEEAISVSTLTGEQHHVDHIVPLKGKKVSGLHVPWNLQVLKASENCRKRNKHY